MSEYKEAAARMNPIEALVGVVSPKRAYERMLYREAIEGMRNYDAADNGRINQGWRATNQSAQLTDKLSRNIIRARARDMERNGDVARGMIHAMVRNVVGQGLQMQARTEDEDLNAQLEALFEQWVKPRNCDLLEQQTMDEMCRMIVRRRYVDGGILIVKRYVPGRVVPFCIHLLEVDELDEWRTSPSLTGGRVVDGIEYDKFGRRTGYWIREYDSDGNQTMKSTFLRAEDVIFYMAKDRPSQRREMSQLAATLSRIRDMNQFMEAVSLKERIAACLAVFVKKQAPAPTHGRSTLKDQQSKYDGTMLTPGMIRDLQPGDDLSVVAPANQGTGATEFVRLQQRLASSGQGLSYEATSRDLSQVNYSSARQGLIEDEATYAMERRSLIDHVLSEIYREFVLSAILSGAVKVKGFTGSVAPYTAHDWVPPARRWIDPLKEAMADIRAMQAGTKTFAQICAENGQDWRAVLAQQALEKNERERLGLLPVEKKEAIHGATSK